MKYKDLPKEIKSPITGDILKIQNLVDVENDDKLVVASQCTNGEMFWWCNIATYKSENKETVYIPFEEV